MSKIILNPLDDGQKAVEIPLGKTTIGRGPFLGCTDKKVSRNHAVLEVTDKGEVYLTPTHVNPCFFQPTADNPGQILKKDTPHKLEVGDIFSLLPRAFRYQLVVTCDTGEGKTSDQVGLNQQQSEKTNGTAMEIQEETPDKVPRDSVQDSCTEDLNDTTMNEKTFIEEEDPSTNIDKSSLQVEDSIPKKDEPPDNSKESSNKENEMVAEEKLIPEKETIPQEDNCDSNKIECAIGENQSKDNSLDSQEMATSEDTHIEEKSDDISEHTDSFTKETEKQGDEVVPADEKPKTLQDDKVVEENESTLGHDESFPKDKQEKVAEQVELEKSETQSSEVAIESKELKEDNTETTDEQKETDEFQDAETEKAEEKSEGVSEWLEEEGTSTKGGRKRSQATKPRKQAAKRKADGPSKPRGRKKVEYFNFDDGMEGNSQRQVPGRTSSRTNRQTRQGLSLEDFIVSDDDEWQSDQSEPKYRRKRGSRRGDDSGSDWEVEHKRSKKVSHKFYSASDSGSDWENRKKKKGPKGRRRKSKRPAAASETVSDEETEQFSSQVEKTGKRIPCTYGKKCYRKSQNHLNQFSHPGDSDYESEQEETQKNDANPEEESDANKKECPYGASCFRTNPQHKKDFKHTKKVRPQREAAKQADKKTKSSRNSEEVDSYDLNDSLLNDDSDEYKPVDSGSDYESGEKMKRFSKGKTPKSKRGKRV